MEEDGGRAFPIAGMGVDAAGNNVVIHEGMSLRDYFAAKAMQGRMARPTGQLDHMELAIEAYRMADAMLKARS